jgi:hypothetical protein
VANSPVCAVSQTGDVGVAVVVVSAIVVWVVAHVVWCLVVRYKFGYGWYWLLS